MTSSAPGPLRPAYSERLGVPASYWIVTLLLATSIATALGMYLGPQFAIGASLVTAAAIAALFVAAGSTRIQVDDQGLRVGSSLLEWEYLGGVESLDADACRRRLGPDADLRAFVVDRPYLNQAVEVEVSDASDPHPYWLIATRSPVRLARALASGRPAAPEAT